MRGTGTGRTSTAPEVTGSTPAGEVLQATSPSVTVRLPVARAVPLRRDATYDAAGDVVRMPVEVQFLDGSTVRTELVLNGPQLYAGYIQLERAVAARETALRGA
ncbi:hypothetical protein ACIOUE_07125 [Streptomyces xanthochromogenes]|uniref:hypothetical protein n=1 Tax=Streptomyces xanthochromogenes TaxID=67384 RepID=UPI00343211BA